MRPRYSFPRLRARRNPSPAPLTRRVTLRLDRETVALSQELVTARRGRGLRGGDAGAHGSRAAGSAAAVSCRTRANPLLSEVTAIVGRHGMWFIAHGAGAPGANGQGRAKRACLKPLPGAIELTPEARRQGALRGLPAGASREMAGIGGSALALCIIFRKEAVPGHREIPGRPGRKDLPRS